MSTQVITKVARAHLTEEQPSYQLAPGESVYVDVAAGVQAAVYLPDIATSGCAGSPCAAKLIAGFTDGATLTLRPAQSSSDAVDETDGIPIANPMQSLLVRAAGVGFWYIESVYIGLV